MFHLLFFKLLPLLIGGFSAQAASSHKGRVLMTTLAAFVPHSKLASSREETITIIHKVTLYLVRFLRRQGQDQQLPLSSPMP